MGPGDQSTRMVTLTVLEEQETSCVQAVILAREAELGGRPPAALITLADRLEAQPGLSAWFVDRSRPRTLPASIAERFIHAPMPAQAGYSAPPASLVEVLARAGMACPERLDASVQAWMDVFSLIKPALLVCQQAPVAALAARMMDLPVVHFGPGWSIGLEPLAFRPWSGKPGQDDAAMDALLASINTVLGRHGQSALQHLGELYGAIDHVLIQGWPELDLYPRSGQARYTGCWPAAPMTPARREPGRKLRILAMLENRRELRNLLAWLVDEDCVCCLDLPPTAVETARHFTGAAMTLRANRPTQNDELDVDLVICHGQHEAVMEALGAGRPLLILPQSPLEKRLASQLEALGLAVILSSPARPADWHAALASLIQDTTIQQRALAWAQQHSVALADPVQRIIRLCQG